MQTPSPTLFEYILHSIDQQKGIVNTILGGEMGGIFFEEREQCAFTFEGDLWDSLFPYLEPAMRRLIPRMASIADARRKWWCHEVYCVTCDDGGVKGGYIKFPEVRSRVERVSDFCKVPFYIDVEDSSPQGVRNVTLRIGEEEKVITTGELRLLGSILAWWLTPECLQATDLLRPRRQCWGPCGFLANFYDICDICQ